MVDIEEVICPYDKSHSIIVSRFTTHLVKCAKNFPDCKKVPCCFNSKHIIPEEEVLYHKQNCPDRNRLDQFLNRIGDVECPVKGELPVAIEVPPPDENWEDDIITESPLTNVMKNIESKKIMRNFPVMGQSKAKRKQFRVEERHRLNALSINDPAPTGRPPFKPVNDEARGDENKKQPSAGHPSIGANQSATDSELNESGFLKKPIRAPRTLSTATQIGLAIKLGKKASAAPEEKKVAVVPPHPDTRNDDYLLEEASGGGCDDGSTSSASTPCLYDDSRYYGDYRGGYTDGLDSNYNVDDGSEDYDYGDRIALAPPAGRAAPPSGYGARSGSSSTNFESEEVSDSSYPSSITDPSANFEENFAGGNEFRTPGGGYYEDDDTVTEKSVTPDFAKENTLTKNPLFEFDEFGFLKMPIPGKGRGRGRGRLTNA